MLLCWFGITYTDYTLIHHEEEVRALWAQTAPELYNSFAVKSGCRTECAVKDYKTS